MKNVKIQIVAAVLGLFIVVSTFLALYIYQGQRVDMSAIEHILSLQKGPNDFLDLANDINVESVDDIGFIVEGEYDINIHYGSQVIEMNSNCFTSKEFRQGLERIGILVYTHENDDGSILYRVTYWGDEAEQYSRID